MSSAGAGAGDRGYGGGAAAAVTVSDAPLGRDLGRSRFGMERVGSRATLVLVVVLAALLLVSAALASKVVDPGPEPVAAGTQITLSGVDDVVVTVPAGWQRDEGASDSSELVLVRPGLTVDIRPTTTGVVDVDVFYARTVRLLAMSGLSGTASDVTRTALPDGQQVTGTVTGDSRTVHLAVAARGPDHAGYSLIGSTPLRGGSAAQDAQRQFDELVKAVSVR